MVSARNRMLISFNISFKTVMERNEKLAHNFLQGKLNYVMLFFLYSFDTWRNWPRRWLIEQNSKDHRLWIGSGSLQHDQNVCCWDLCLDGTGSYPQLSIFYCLGCLEVSHWTAFKRHATSFFSALYKQEIRLLWRSICLPLNIHIFIALQTL